MNGWTCPDCGRVNDRTPTRCPCGWASDTAALRTALAAAELRAEAAERALSEARREVLAALQEWDEADADMGPLDAPHSPQGIRLRVAENRLRALASTTSPKPLATCNGDVGWHLRMVNENARLRAEVEQLRTALAAAERERDEAREAGRREAERERSRLSLLVHDYGKEANVLASRVSALEGALQECIEREYYDGQMDPARAALSAPAPHLIHDFHEGPAGAWRCACGEVSKGPLAPVVSLPAPAPDAAREDGAPDEMDRARAQSIGRYYAEQSPPLRSAPAPCDCGTGTGVHSPRCAAFDAPAPGNAREGLPRCATCGAAIFCDPDGTKHCACPRMP